MAKNEANVRVTTPAEHAARHQRLHESLDELVADFLVHNSGKRLGNTTVMELLEWSHRQTPSPETKT